MTLIRFGLVTNLLHTVGLAFAAPGVLGRVLVYACELLAGLRFLQLTAAAALAGARGAKVGATGRYSATL